MKRRESGDRAKEKIQRVRRLANKLDLPELLIMVGVIPLALSDPTWFPLSSAIAFGLIAFTLLIREN